MIITYKGHKHIPFGKGVYLSIFNGFGSYSQNHYQFKKRKKKIVITKDCEIAILRNNRFITSEVLNGTKNGTEIVRGYITKKELKEIIEKIKKYVDELE